MVKTPVNSPGATATLVEPAVLPGMKRREFIAFCSGAAVWPLAARAKQKAMPVIGLLGLATAAVYAPWIAVFRRGLDETGYVEGQNVAIEYRWAEDRVDRLPALAADLVSRKVDVIATTGGTAGGFGRRKARPLPSRLCSAAAVTWWRLV